MKSLGLLIVLLSWSLFAQGQKIKYKDLYVLLETKDYDRAEPFLRTYLIQEPDDANANLQMGFILEDKSESVDILKETARLIELCDSATLYYNKANSYIDEKEVKKHDEYYKDYYRRDLRTGKYGVKLADVKFDIEKRVSALQSKSQNATAVKDAFITFESDYKNTLELYNSFSSDYESYNIMLFNSDEELQERFSGLIESYDKFLADYENYKTLLKAAGDVGYNQSIVETDIIGFANTEEHNPDFYSPEIEIFELKKWAETSQTKINKEITVFLTGLISYQTSLNEIQAKVAEQKEVMDPDKTGISPEVLIEKLKVYDEDPFPHYLYEYKKSEIRFLSKLNELSKEGFEDTTNYFYKSVKIDELTELHGTMKESYEVLKDKSEKHGTSLYTKLLVEEGDLNSYLDTQYKFIIAEEIKIGNITDDFVNATMWAYTESDSISLVIPETLVEAVEGDMPYITYALDTLSETEIVVSGFHRNGEGFEGFLAVVESDLKARTFNIVDFEGVIGADSVISIHCFSKPVMDSLSYEFVTAFVNIDGVNDEFPSRVVRTDSTGVTMNKFFTWDSRPRDFVVNSEDGSLQVLLLEEEPESVYVSLDKDGNVLNQ